MSDASPPRVHPAARGFDTAAEAYQRARPEYPPAAVRAVGEHLGLGPGSVVIDLAAGTGKLTRALRDLLGVDPIAVEPSEGMRRAFLAANPGIRVLDGTAERMPLPDGKADAVVVGQAFHWFRLPEALHEIARVLRPTGGLAMLWNVRDERVGWVQRFGEIVRAANTEGAPSTRDGTWRAQVDGSNGFGALGTARFESFHPLTVDGLVDRALSISYVARLPPDGQAEVAAAVRRLAATDPEVAGRDRIEFPYVTEIYWARRS